MAGKTIAIIGGGPAGLMAADRLAGSGHEITVYDAMPTLGRKFLLAGKSGLNITHAEDHDRLLARFGSSRDRLRAALDGFPASALRAWAAALGTDTFVDSSGRVFPTAMKASPLLRSWLRDLDSRGVRLRPRHRWRGFADAGHRFDTPEGERVIAADATVLALGGGSWPRLGSDGRWVPWLAAAGIAVQPLSPANCGFDAAWTDGFRDRFAGVPVKAVTATSEAGTRQGEFVISRHGIEGSLVYVHAQALREQWIATGAARLVLDLAPGLASEHLAARLERQPRKASLSARLRKAAGLEGVKAGLLRECTADLAGLSPQAMAARIKALPLTLLRPRPIEEAISSAGGVSWEAVGPDFMLRDRPGLFVAGEMLDWEAPTGGYLLTACFATGRAAAAGVLDFLEARSSPTGR